MDLAPTIMHILGIPVPEHVDGRVLSEQMRNAEAPVARQPSGAADWSREVTEQDEGSGLTAEEEEELTERLRHLGYLD